MQNEGTLESVRVRWLLLGPLGKEYQNPVDMVSLSHTVTAQVASAELCSPSSLLSALLCLGHSFPRCQSVLSSRSWTRVNSVVLHTDLSTHTWQLLWLQLSAPEQKDSCFVLFLVNAYILVEFWVFLHLTFRECLGFRGLFGLSTNLHIC